MDAERQAGGAVSAFGTAEGEGVEVPPKRTGRHPVLETILVITRWVSLAPAAIAGAWVAYFVMNLASRFSMIFVGADPNSFMCRVYLGAMSGMVIAVGFIFVGTIMAPAYRTETTLILGVVGLLAVGMMIWAALLQADYWALWSDLFAAIGVAMATYEIAGHEPVDWWKSSWGIG